MTGVLVLDDHAQIYADNLHREFPALTVHAARDEISAPKDLSAINVFIAFGNDIGDDLFRRMPGLKWIQSLATGTDQFLRMASLGPDVLITSARGIHGPPMRELVAYFMLFLARDAMRQIADQKAHRWDRRYWSLLAGKTAVIVGLGVGGTAIGELLKPFGMTVIGVSRAPRPVAGFDEVVPRARLPEAARRADYLINILPSAPENRDLIGKDVFGAMKPTAFFINVGRGDTVDENAVIAALREKRIAGAGLDVFRSRPLAAESPLWDMPNVVLTPHSGAYVREYEDYMMPIVLGNMRLFLAGRLSEMQNIVAR
jgi:phosphoglycerate dehydrogenase-like enzyme